MNKGAITKTESRYRASEWPIVHVRLRVREGARRARGVRADMEARRRAGLGDALGGLIGSGGWRRRYDGASVIREKARLFPAGCCHEGTAPPLVL